MSDLHMREHWVDTAQGKLFAQDWTPLQAQGAPIVLLHDSLGVCGVVARLPSAVGASHRAPGNRLRPLGLWPFGRASGQFAVMPLRT